MAVCNKSARRFREIIFIVPVELILSVLVFLKLANFSNNKFNGLQGEKQKVESFLPKNPKLFLHIFNSFDAAVEVLHC